MEEALSAMCADDVVCEVAAVEAVCEDILETAEEELNQIDFGTRHKREAVSYFFNDDNDGKRWIYWEREEFKEDKSKRFKRSLTNVNHSKYFGKVLNKSRLKRQFGLINDFVRPKKTNNNEDAELSKKKDNNNYMGVLLNAMMQDLGSDIGVVRLSSFLENIQERKPSDDYGVNELLSDFSEEFGEEKLKSLKSIMRTKIKGVDIPELDGEHKTPQDDTDLVFPDELKKFLKKNLKVKFKVSGKEITVFILELEISLVYLWLLM